MKDVLTVDIFSKGWTTPLGIGFWSGQNYHEFLRKEANEDIVWHFLDLLGHLQDSLGKNKKEKVIYSHSKDNHVNLLFLKAFTDRPDEVIEPLPGLGEIRWKDKKLVFRNFYKILPFNLDYLKSAFEVFSELDYDLRDPLYSFRPALKDHCTSLEEVITTWEGIMQENFGRSFASTLANTSMNTYQKRFKPSGGMEANESFSQFIKLATYGGRNEIYNSYGENINCYDVNSMYTSCYDTPIPVGKMHWIPKKEMSMEGGVIAHAKVKVPSTMYLGPLPVHYYDNLIFPVGDLPPSWWDMVELRNAVELGCDITLLAQIGCKEETSLKEFGAHILDLRGEQPRLHKIWKQFGVVLYSKFASNTRVMDIRHASQVPWGDETVLKIPIPESNETFYYVLTNRFGRNRVPAVNMRIRAEARIRHLKYLLQASELGEIYYCDVDSLFTSAQMETSNRPGDLGLQYKRAAWKAYFIKQKFYALVFPGNKLMSRTAGYSGSPLKEEDFRQLLNKKPIELEDYRNPTMKTILAYEPLERQRRTSTIYPTEPRNRLMVETKTFPIQLPLAQEVAEELIEELEISHAT